MPTIQELAGTTLRRETDRGRITGLLGDVRNAAVDVVTNHSALHWSQFRPQEAQLVTPGQQFLLPDGVYDHLDLTATRTAVSQQAARLKVPMQYVDRLHPDHVDLFATTMNTLAQREDKTALLRFLRCSDGFLLRAVLSDRFAAVDNVDFLQAIMTGLSNADVGLEACEVDADWTLDRFRLRIAVPQIAIAVPDLLVNYRPPYSMLPGRTVHAPADAGEVSPLLWAGLEASNGETGGGALRLAPRAVLQVCRNGLTRTADLIRQVHVGERLDEGIRWSDDTRRLSVELLAAKVADATRTFCSVDYLTGIANEMRVAKGMEVQSPSAAVQVLSRQVSLSETEAQSVLDLFAMSGDATVFGLGQALTAAAQSATSGDRQAEMEDAMWAVFARPAMYAEAAA